MRHTITIDDYNNPSSLKKAITKLQKRRKKILRDLGYDQIYFNSNKYNRDTIYPIFENILNSNLDKIYDETVKSSYYVYLHLNPLKPLNIKNNIKHLFLAAKFNILYEPFYVGKGEGNRYLNFNRNDSHRKIRSQIRKFKDKDIIAVKISENLKENQALALESKLIDILGLRALSNNGMLTNLDEGKQSSERRKIYLEKENNYTKKILESNGFKKI